MTTTNENKTFYVYAGYYEAYISSKKMSAPYSYQGEFQSLEEALCFCDEELPNANVVFCENVRDDYEELFCIIDKEQEDMFFNEDAYFVED